MSVYIVFPLKDGAEHIVTVEEGDEYERMFPKINVPQEFCSMRVWLKCNPERRKTKRGINRFIAHWLINAALREETPWKVKMEARVGFNPRGEK